MSHQDPEMLENSQDSTGSETKLSKQTLTNDSAMNDSQNGDTDYPTPKVENSSPKVADLEPTVLEDDPQVEIQKTKTDLVIVDKTQKHCLPKSEKEIGVLGQDLQKSDPYSEAYLKLQKEHESLKKSHDELLRARKELESLRGEDLKSLVSTREENKRLNNLHHDTSDAIRLKDEEIGNLKVKNAILEENLIYLNAESLAQAKQLQSCKDDLFRLRPSAQVTDSDIVAHYDSLCQKISEWVGSELFGFEERSSDSTPAITDGGNPDWKALLDRVRKVDEYLVRSIIHTQFQERFFGGQTLYFGILSQDTKRLHEIMEGMVSLEPRKDAFTIHGWRSDTLHAVAATKRVRSNREEWIKGVAAGLFVDLCNVFPGLRGESSSTLLNEIVIPAAELEAKIHLSSTRYSFSREQSSMLGDIKIEDMRNTAWVDVKTRKAVDPTSDMVITDRRGALGESLLQAEPGLSRINNDQKEVVLRPSKYVIQLYGPAQKRTKKSN